MLTDPGDVAVGPLVVDRVGRLVGVLMGLLMVAEGVGDLVGGLVGGFACVPGGFAVQGLVGVQWAVVVEQGDDQGAGYVQAAGDLAVFDFLACCRSPKMRMWDSFRVPMWGREKAPPDGFRRGLGRRGDGYVVILM
jgi:hypothetical protein